MSCELKMEVIMILYHTTTPIFLFTGALPKDRVDSTGSFAPVLNWRMQKYLHSSSHVQTSSRNGEGLVSMCW